MVMTYEQNKKHILNWQRNNKERVLEIGRETSKRRYIIHKLEDNKKRCALSRYKGEFRRLSSILLND